ncbi:heme-dependent oxidative N-demethylase family protein [Sphingomonas lenta]|uniref:DUF3445 domain-containing protein n=1 Tax=Sphingomonas lenta TaxID=1141887 RepID=A0A2A2SGN3_9SPHN|nr:DUF3445 domain-containing protein [Sphingomonas lenta]PAX08181.1 hypothetical protein CKY28_11430 [Sphingomonas lenta]
MTLGFSVAELAPVGSAPGGLKMGLRRLSEADWLQRDFDRAARASVFDAHPDAVRVLPEAESAVRELAAMLGVPGGLAEAARATWEDLCLLLPGPDGAYRLVAGAVGFPTDWRLHEKMGLPLAEVHAPIHGYAEKLSSGVDHFFATLRPGPIFGRANWFVVPTADWRYLPEGDPAERFAQVTPDNAGRTLFVRCERQTLRRLPDSGAVLFTIGIHVARLDALPDSVVQGVAHAVIAVPAGERERRAAPYYADALAAYACGLADRTARSAA